MFTLNGGITGITWFRTFPSVLFKKQLNRHFNSLCVCLSVSPSLSLSLSLSVSLSLPPLFSLSLSLSLSEFGKVAWGDKALDPFLQSSHWHIILQSMSGFFGSDGIHKSFAKNCHFGQICWLSHEDSKKLGPNWPSLTHQQMQNLICHILFKCYQNPV